MSFLNVRPVLKLAIIFGLLSLISSCRQDTAAEEASLDDELAALLATIEADGLAAFRMPESNDFANIPQDPNNPLSEVKVLLGKFLFHETGIGLAPKVGSAMGTFSCASCHFAQGGFQANRFQGIGEGGEGFFNRQQANTHLATDLDVQPIRTPTAMNGAYQDVMLWNGQFGATGTNAGTEASWTPDTPKETNALGYQGLETQAIAGLGVHRLVIDRDFMLANGYDALFEAAFPDFPEEDKMTAETAGLAIAAYERTILANRSPWQQWLRGRRDLMTMEEKRGAMLFFGRAECVSCHSGPSLASMSFHAIGMNDLDQHPSPTFGTRPDNVENRGRGGFTGNAEDNYRFKTPQLYNLADSPFYGHGSSLTSLRDVVDYKNDARPENDRVPTNSLSPLFQPLGLSATEIEELTLFLEKSLYDENLERYVPTVLLSGNCFPNSDATSVADLECN